MFLKKIGAGLSGAFALGGALLWSTAASALPVDWQTGFQPAVTPVMVDIEEFHKELLVIITLVTLLVLALLVWVIVRYNHRRNPVPSKTAHNTLLEVAWTLVPVIILVVIAIPSFRLLYFEATIPTPDVTIKAIGKQWFWSYEYPASKIAFDSLGLSDADAAKKGEPRLLGVDNAIWVPVNKVVEVETTGADVIHSWAVPQFGVKMDAVPGRINHTWFKATKIGTYYGECSELCGARHAFMPIEVHVVSEADYAAWLAQAKTKFSASLDTPTRVAAK
ncbi:MAG: cytochrome c oxidase subunit II [Proteobacteria bacterium]|jgi:cytochrome c oxidase subunit 2|nr:cytochrome c oxidase subunit II [Pseudomonadota bacterium]